MVLNVWNNRDHAALTSQSAVQSNRGDRLAGLFGDRDTAAGGAKASYGRTSRAVSGLYTARGTAEGVRFKRRFAELDKRTSVQRVLDQISRAAYRDWKDTALYGKMSLISKMFQGGNEKAESKVGALDGKDVNTLSKPYPQKDALAENRSDADVRAGEDAGTKDTQMIRNAQEDAGAKDLQTIRNAQESARDGIFTVMADDEEETYVYLKKAGERSEEETEETAKPEKAERAEETAKPKETDKTEKTNEPAKPEKDAKNAPAESSAKTDGVFGAEQEDERIVPDRIFRDI